MDISGFQGEYRFLSNFWPCDIIIVGVPYKNVEAAYQASKTINMNMRKQFSCLGPKEAKHEGRLLPLRGNWDDVLKIECMELCLRAKFAIPHLKDLLISTASRELIEANNWGDQFWGVSRGSGRNILGKLLMGLRDEAILYKPEELSDICEHLHVHKGEVYDDRDDEPRTFDNYDDIPF